MKASTVEVSVHHSRPILYLYYRKDSLRSIGSEMLLLGVRERGDECWLLVRSKSAYKQMAGKKCKSVKRGELQ
jgi:hypothetical protein